MSYLPRPLDPGEAFFFMSDHLSSMNFVVFAERTGNLAPERLRSALDTLQSENLLLQTRIGWNDAQGLYFEHAPANSIALQCQPVSADNWQGPIEAEFSRPFALGTAPLMRCIYLQQPERCVLALSFHHAIADGRAGIALLRQLLGLLAADAAMPPKANAAALPAMIDLMPPHFRWAEQPEAAKQLKAALINDYRRHGAPATLPWLDSANSVRSPKFIRLTLNPDLTAQLIERARQHRTSVHGVLCAAQLMAQSALQTDGAATTFLLSSPVDMRAHLEPAPPASPAGLFVSIISATFPVDAQTQVWPLAQDIVRQTRLQISRGEGHLFYNMFGLDGAPVLPERMAGFHKKLQSSLHNTMISNVGQVADIEDDPAVEAISFALCPMPYQALFTAASTYRGQLILNVGFDAAKLAPSDAQTLTERIHEVLHLATRGD
jgi:NRPS condensation-like uncharacterized protein